jgi:DNA-binding transcriptional LysR family regulator
LTLAGAQLQADVDRLLSLAAEIEERSRARAAQVAGLLKINASTPLGRLLLIPALPQFLRQYPELRLDLRLSDSGEDLIEGGRDAAIWFGELPDRRLRYRTIARTRRITCAAPSYLEAFGTPRVIGDLRQHRCLATSGWWQQLNWRFADQRAFDDLKLEAFMQLNSSDALRAATLHGLGIAQGSSLMFNTSLLAKRALVQLFADQVMSGEDIHVVYPSTRVENPLVRVFIDFVVSLMEHHLHQQGEEAEMSGRLSQGR